jgi:hypothetical protein
MLFWLIRFNREDLPLRHNATKFRMLYSRKLVAALVVGNSYFSCITRPKA